MRKGQADAWARTKYDLGDRQIFGPSLLSTGRAGPPQDEQIKHPIQSLLSAEISAFQNNLCPRRAQVFLPH